jgi:c-di-GMP-binding flagellar brake protein YcgR
MHETPTIGERYGAPEEIADRIRILALLQRIVSERLFVTVAIPGDAPVYNSTLLAVDGAEGVCLLDSLHPEDGNVRAEAVGRVRVFAGFDGAALSFEAVVLGAAAVSGLPVLRIAVPGRMLYAQRRSRYRVQIGDALEIPVLLTGSGGTLQGGLYDISATGLSVRLSREAAPPAPGDLCEGELRVPGEAQLTCRLEVRDLRFASDGSPVVGGCFQGADVLFMQRVERLVVELERRLLQRRSDPA